VKHAAFVAGAALLAVAAPARADSDVQQWSEIGVDYGIDKKTSVGAVAGIRFDQDVSRVAEILPEAGIAYKIKKWFRIGAGYRFEYSRDEDDEFVPRHRFDGFVRLHQDAGDVRFEARLKYTESIRPDKNDDFKHTVRPRALVAYRASKRWVPSISAEGFLAIDDNDEAVGLAKMRYTLAVAHDMKDQELEVYYRLEQPVADPMDPLVHIIGLGLYFDL
jgi:hypothetical protein